VQKYSIFYRQIYRIFWKILKGFHPLRGFSHRDAFGKTLTFQVFSNFIPYDLKKTFPPIGVNPFSVAFEL